jgi:hypothetical protein
MGAKSAKSQSLNRNSSILTKVTPEGFWMGLQVAAKVPDPILFDELPDDDKAIIIAYLKGRSSITLKELERLVNGGAQSVLQLLERLRLMT